MSLREYLTRRTADAPFAFLGQAPFLAAFVHVLVAALAITYCRWWSPWWTVEAVLAFAAVKEGLIDPWWEGDNIYPDGLIDFAGYVAGCFVGIGMYYVQ